MFYIFAILNVCFLILLLSVLRPILSKNIVALWDQDLVDALAVFLSTRGTVIDRKWSASTELKTE